MIAAPRSDLSTLLDCYRHMVMAREVDRLEEQYIQRGEAFFQVSGAGHEAMAALAAHLVAEDFLHLHYRDKALMLARGIAPEMFFASLFCNDLSPSRGRQMSAHLSDRARHVVSLVGPVGNNALQAVGIAMEIAAAPNRPLVVCAVGDGGAQQGEVLEAIAEAVRWSLPVLFVIEDNHYAISSRTRGRTFFDLPEATPTSFMGLPIHRLDGRDAAACQGAFGAIVADIRATRRPALAHLNLERLARHTHADDETLYRGTAEIAHVQATADPIPILRGHLLAAGVGATDLERLEAAVRAEVAVAAKVARAGGEPAPVRQAKCPLPPELTDMANEYRGGRQGARLNLRETIQGTLQRWLRDDPRVSLYGEDIEDPKGDVFGVTRGLSSRFPGRVVNAPLSESTIVGTAIGRALAGGRPVAFLQFADFLPLAFNQIAAELGSLYWRSNGAWECPVIVMVACGAYRPGLGPFHSQSLEALVAHIPGLDVLMPANAADAAGLLNAAFLSRRPTLFFYPKGCLNRDGPDDTTSDDLDRHLVPLGRARVIRPGVDISLVGYGNTVAICRQAADTLAAAGVSVELIDLRALSPWDEAAVLLSCEKTGHLLVVHEDNRTCGFGAEILATVMERACRPVRARRVARPDTWLPAHHGNQLALLPSVEGVLEAAAALLNLSLEWPPASVAEPNILLLEASGSSPSDHAVMLMQWHVQAGDSVREGQPLATIEATKSLIDLDSPVAGTVEVLLAAEADTVAVGAAIARIRLAAPATAALGAPSRRAAPIIRRAEPYAPPREERTPRPDWASSANPAGIVAIDYALGSRRVDNAEILRPTWGITADDILRRTGIQSRRRAGPGEDVVSLGAAAARRLLDRTGLGIDDFGLVICATATPDLLSPSVACRILHRLGAGTGLCPAYDLNAACAGYVYGLAAARDYLLAHPKHRVLLLTSEMISPHLDDDDSTTAILFGDGASATILAGAAHAADFRLDLAPVFLATSPEPGQLLRLPHAAAADALAMDGTGVFEQGVRAMSLAMKKAVELAGIPLDGIDLLVPHQANMRMLDIVRAQLRLPADRLFSNLREIGNTSSSSIPIALAQVLDAPPSPFGTLGITAFGAGLAYGACVLRSVPSSHEP